jgi:hypothetical protein
MIESTLFELNNSGKEITFSKTSHSEDIVCFPEICSKIYSLVYIGLL